MKLLLRNYWFWSMLFLFVLHQAQERWMGIRITWVDNYLDDLLCMPILLSGWLAEQYDLFDKKRLCSWETAGLWVLISLLFEGVLPRFYPAYTADGWDVLCYGIGSAFFYYRINPVERAVRYSPDLGMISVFSPKY